MRWRSRRPPHIQRWSRRLRLRPSPRWYRFCRHLRAMAGRSSQPTHRQVHPSGVSTARGCSNKSCLAKQGREGARFLVHGVPAMAFRPANFPSSLAVALGLAALLGAGGSVVSQVFVVGEKSATADVSSDFHPTRVELPKTPITERGRRDLVRNLEAEQGFAHRPLPLGDSLTLMANGNMTPNGDSYTQLLYKKGQAAALETGLRSPQ